MLELAQQAGISFYMAYTIVKMIEAGFSIATIIAAITGVASWLSLFFYAIRRQLWTMAATSVALW